MNKSVTKYLFPDSSFHADHDVDIHFHVQQLLRNLEGLLQLHLSPFIPPPFSVLSQYISFYEVRWNMKKDVKTTWPAKSSTRFYLDHRAGKGSGIFKKKSNAADSFLQFFFLLMFIYKIHVIR